MLVGIVGWRGMVGSVLLKRMEEEGDFADIDIRFYTTSDVGGEGPEIGGKKHILSDAYDLADLEQLDVLLTCQGSDYTNKVYSYLRNSGWNGFWIDAASALRMENDALIVLDPVNRAVIDKGLQDGIKTYSGGNCTVSLMIMALAGLFRANLIEWVSSMTYQAASGAGAANMKELVAQASFVTHSLDALDSGKGLSGLKMAYEVNQLLKSDRLPVAEFGHPLSYNVLPFIDKELENGQSREEWKGVAETNKILNPATPIMVDGVCVRVGALRCHSQGLTIKLKRDVPIGELEQMIATSHEWVSFVPNTRHASLTELTPVAIDGTLKVAIGRLRKMSFGGEFLTAFTVGDQLLWGAAEPLRRMLRILRAY